MALSETGIRSPRGFVHRRERLGFVSLTLGLMVPVLLFVGFGVYGRREFVLDSWQDLLVWTLAFAVLNAFDLQGWGGRILAPDVPVLLALCLTFPPAIAGMVAFIGTIDRRELTGQLTVTRSLFNRTQGAVLAILPAAVAFQIPASLGTPWWLVVATASSLAVLTATNYALVSLGARVADGTPFLESLQNLVLGRPADFATTWVVWGLMGMLLVAAESSVGTLAIVVFMGPALIGRQVLARSRSTLQAEADIRGKERAVTELSSRIFDERRDERERIASNLHDEVLQPLYQVSLMCDVVKQDSASGRLLELDKDVPLLNHTVAVASKNLRAVIGRLRNSPIGIRGLPSTLRGLVRDLAAQSTIRIEQSIDDVRVADPALQLTIYQVAKEALFNAVKHSRARQIHVRLGQDSDAIRLSVEDDGVGFEPQVAQQDHFGLLIMRERAESVAGVFLVDSRLGKGTIVAARFPNQENSSY
jgi:signal transduction histidine kinase